MIKGLLATEQRSAIEQWCRGRAHSVPTPSGETLCRVLGELTMAVTLKDLSIAPHLALDGFWETWNSICLARNLVKGWKSIDVGANFGYFSLLIAMLTGAEVEAWEPSNVLLPLLKQNIAMNGMGSLVTTMGYAAGSEPADAFLLHEPSDFGSAVVRELAPSTFVAPIAGETGVAIPSYPELSAQPIKVLRLDDTRLSGVDFVKIDAEGKEPEIWQGMQRLVSSGDLKAVLMEWSPKRYADPKGFLESIEKAGFRVSVVDATGTPKPPSGDITTVDGHLDLWLRR